MNVLKNFEAVFVITAALACSAVYSLDRAPVADTTASSLPTVVVSAKRMSAEEKLQSLQQERATLLATEASDAKAI